MTVQQPPSLVFMACRAKQTMTRRQGQRAGLRPAAFAWARVPAHALARRLRVPARPRVLHLRRCWSARALRRKVLLALCCLSLIREATERLVKRKGRRGREAKALLGRVRAPVSAPARLPRRVGAPSSLSIKSKMPQQGGGGGGPLVREGLVRRTRQALQVPRRRRAMTRRRLVRPRTLTCGF